MNGIPNAQPDPQALGSYSVPFVSEQPDGELVARRFLVGSAIAHGPSGLICRAKTLDDQRPLAIRFTRSAREDSRSIKRFRQAMEAATKLTGEHVAQIIGTGGLPSGVQYLASELLAGESLMERLGRVKFLPVALAVRFAREICAALTEAHAAGIVHRDIKPSNVFLESTGGGERVKVLDFGIPKALVLNRGDASAYAADRVASPSYAAPEQIASPAIVDARADLWAVGVVLNEMLTGHRPFEGESRPELFARILGERPASIRATRSDLDRGLEAVVLRCLAKDPAHRFQSATALSRALEPFEHGRSWPANESPSLAARALSLPLKSTRSIWLGVAVASIVLAGTVAGVWVSNLTTGSPVLAPDLDTAAIAAPREYALPLVLSEGLRAEPETKARRGHVARAGTTRQIDVDRDSNLDDAYRDYLKQNGMRSPADVYILERRIYDSKGNLLDVQTRVLDGAAPPAAPEGSELPTRSPAVPTASASAAPEHESTPLPAGSD